jgi:peptidoglycan-N-acetylglucosamine deacetylase
MLPFISLQDKKVVSIDEISNQQLQKELKNEKSKYSNAQIGYTKHSQSSGANSKQPKEVYGFYANWKIAPPKRAYQFKPLIG